MASSKRLYYSRKLTDDEMLNILYASESESSENSDSGESVSDNSSRPSESEESDSSSNSDGDVVAPSTSTQKPKKSEEERWKWGKNLGKSTKFLFSKNKYPAISPRVLRQFLSEPSPIDIQIKLFRRTCGAP